MYKVLPHNLYESCILVETSLSGFSKSIFVGL